MHGAAPEPSTLSIGELAARTGVAVATLRAWEQRHGFPTPHHTSGGHRRYAATDVAAVLDVRRLRLEGRRLDAAIAEATATHAPGAPGHGSLFATMRVSHPQLTPRRLSKRTLLAMSWAIEDEILARGDRPHLFGAFQKGRHFVRSEDRWHELARVARTTCVLAAFGARASGSGDGAEGPVRVVEVDLPDDAPMQREWAVVSDGAHLPAALTAWELPGQGGVADRDRVFEAVWTLDPGAVRGAARLCAQVCDEHGAPGAGALRSALAGPPSSSRLDVDAAVSVLNRMVLYVDQGHRGG